MPKNIVMSIKSKYAKMIYAGTKAYEYRKTIAILPQLKKGDSGS